MTGQPDTSQPENFEHNPDINPKWTPKVGRRVYACKECGTEKIVSTNHTGTVWAEPCAGSCKNIYHAHTSRERVEWHPARPHAYVREA